MALRRADNPVDKKAPVKVKLIAQDERAFKQSPAAAPVPVSASGHKEDVLAAVAAVRARRDELQRRMYVDNAITAYLEPPTASSRAPLAMRPGRQQPQTTLPPAYASSPIPTFASPSTALSTPLMEDVSTTGGEPRSQCEGTTRSEYSPAIAGAGDAIAEEAVGAGSEEQGLWVGQELELGQELRDFDRPVSQEDKPQSSLSRSDSASKLSGYKTEAMLMSAQLQEEDKLRVAEQHRRRKLLISADRGPSCSNYDVIHKNLKRLTKTSPTAKPLRTRAMRRYDQVVEAKRLRIEEEQRLRRVEDEQRLTTRGKFAREICMGKTALLRGDETPSRSPGEPLSSTESAAKLSGYKTMGMLAYDQRQEEDKLHAEERHRRRTPNLRHDPQSARPPITHSASTHNLSAYKTKMILAEEQLRQKKKLHLADKERRWKLITSSEKSSAPRIPREKSVISPEMSLVPAATSVISPNTSHIGRSFENLSPTNSFDDDLLGDIVYTAVEDDEDEEDESKGDGELSHGELSQNRSEGEGGEGGTLSSVYVDAGELVSTHDSLPTGTLARLVAALRAGDLELVISLHASSNANLHLPFSFCPDEPYAVHCAAGSKSVALMRWLLEDKHCPTKMKFPQDQPLMNKNGETVLAVAAREGDVRMMRYLVRNVSVTDIPDIVTAHRALHALLEAPGPKPRASLSPLPTPTPTPLSSFRLNAGVQLNSYLASAAFAEQGPEGLEQWGRDKQVALWAVEDKLWAAEGKLVANQRVIDDLKQKLKDAGESAEERGRALKEDRAAMQQQIDALAAERDAAHSERASHAAAADTADAAAQQTAAEIAALQQQVQQLSASREKQTASSSEADALGSEIRNLQQVEVEAEVQLEAAVQAEAEVEVQTEVKLVVGVESQKLADGDAQEGEKGDANAETSEQDQEREQIKRHINRVNSLANTHQPRKSLSSDPPAVNSRSVLSQEQEQMKRHINRVNSINAITDTDQSRKSLSSDSTINSRSFIAQKSGYMEAARLSSIPFNTPPPKAPVQIGWVTLQRKLSEKSLCKV